MYDDSDADAAAFGGDERYAQEAVVPPDPRSLAQASPRISSFCVCARVPFVYKPFMKNKKNARFLTCRLKKYIWPLLAPQRWRCFSALRSALRCGSAPSACVLVCSLYINRL